MYETTTLYSDLSSKKTGTRPKSFLEEVEHA
jgi:hypothetical protein